LKIKDNNGIDSPDHFELIDIRYTKISNSAYLQPINNCDINGEIELKTTYNNIEFLRNGFNGISKFEHLDISMNGYIHNFYGLFIKEVQIIDKDVCVTFHYDYHEINDDIKHLRKLKLDEIEGRK